jgi:hypothetical protein
MLVPGAFPPVAKNFIKTLLWPFGGLMNKEKPPITPADRAKSLGWCSDIFLTKGGSGRRAEVAGTSRCSVGARLLSLK